MNSKTIEIVEGLVDAMEGAGLHQLPQEPLGDTVRGTHRQLRYALAEAQPKIKPKDSHRRPFHLDLNARKADLYKQAREEAWDACASMLNSMEFLRVRGCITEFGVELPANGSVGDAYLCLEGAKRSLTRFEGILSKIEALNGQASPARAT
jgi:hypothetical protein